jgi:hypothetical protein
MDVLDCQVLDLFKIIEKCGIFCTVATTFLVTLRLPTTTVVNCRSRCCIIANFGLLYACVLVGGSIIKLCIMTLLMMSCSCVLHLIPLLLLIRKTAQKSKVPPTKKAIARKMMRQVIPPRWVSLLLVVLVSRDYYNNMMGQTGNSKSKKAKTGDMTSE